MVPTGIKIGVSISPWSVVMTAALALLNGSLDFISNFIGGKYKTN
jgi:hypothetical protein